MRVAIGRTVVTATLALLCPLGTGAATPRPADLDMCRAQKQTDCRRVSVAELDRLRGGMLLMTSIGPIEVTFGVTQAIYVNNKLVAMTQLVMSPNPTTPSPSQIQAQIQAANAALRGAPATQQASSTSTGTSAPAGSVPSAPQSATPAAPVAAVAPTSVAPPHTGGLNSTLNAAPNGAAAPGQATSAPSASPTSGSGTQTAGLNGTLSTAANAAAASSAGAAPSGSASPTVAVNGSVVTPGNPIITIPGPGGVRMVIVQNGAGNIAVPNAADIASGVATIVQNTANNQAIRAVTEMNVQIALTKAMTAASISNAVRQGMINSRP